ADGRDVLLGRRWVSETEFDRRLHPGERRRARCPAGRFYVRLKMLTERSFTPERSVLCGKGGGSGSDENHSPSGSGPRRASLAPGLAQPVAPPAADHSP